MVFPESERLIFRYVVRGSEFFADPLVLRRRLIQASGGMIDEILDAAAKGDDPDEMLETPPLAMFLPKGVETPTPEQLEQAQLAARAMARAQAELAREQRAKIVYEAFRLRPLDEKTGEGVTEVEALGVLWEFFEFLEGNASASGTTPISSPSVAGPPIAPATTPPGSVSS